MNHIHKQSKASLVWAMTIITLILTIMNFGKLISYFETCYDLPELATVFTFVQVVCVKLEIINIMILATH